MFVSALINVCLSKCFSLSGFFFLFSFFKSNEVKWCEGSKHRRGCVGALFVFQVNCDLFLAPCSARYSATFPITDHLRCMWPAPQKEVTWLVFLLLLHFLMCRGEGWVQLEEVRGVEVGGGGASVAAGETKPDTGYLEAEMGGACMPNGDTDQRLISLGAHFNLATQNTHTHTHTHFPACAHTHTHTHTQNLKHLTMVHM